MFVPLISIRDSTSYWLLPSKAITGTQFLFEIRYNTYLTLILLFFDIAAKSTCWYNLFNFEFFFFFCFFYKREIFTIVLSFCDRRSRIYTEGIVLLSDSLVTSLLPVSERWRNLIPIRSKVRFSKSLPYQFILSSCQGDSCKTTPLFSFSLCKIIFHFFK